MSPACMHALILNLVHVTPSILDISNWISIWHFHKKYFSIKIPVPHLIKWYHLQYICSDKKKKKLRMFFTHLLIPYAFFRALPNPLVSNFKMYHKFNPSLLSFPSWPSAISSHQLCLILFSPQTFCSPEAVQVIFF